MKKVLFILATIHVWVTVAQVGVGTTNPSSQLEIQSTNTGIPTLELNPQTAPIGSATGQLAVIEDELYMYDATRGKWLSVDATSYVWSKNGPADNEVLRIGGDVRTDNSGIRMPFNGAIVYVTAQSSGGVANKGFDIRVRNGTTTLVTTSFSLIANVFTNTNYNVNFTAGNYINVYVQAAGNTVEDPAVTVWVKWRK